MKATDSRPIRSVLIIEDDPADVSELMRKFSHFERMTVLALHDSNLTDAIKRLEKTRFDVVIADLKLPDADAERVMSDLPPLCATTALIIASGMTPAVLSAAIDSRIDGVLPKSGDTSHASLEAQVLQSLSRKASSIQKLSRMSELEKRVDHQDEELEQLRATQAAEIRKLKASHSAEIAELRLQLARLEGKAEGRGEGIEMSRKAFAWVIGGVASFVGVVVAAVVKALME